MPAQRKRKNPNRPSESVLGNKTLFSLMLEKGEVNPVWSENYNQAMWRICKEGEIKNLWSFIVSDEWTDNIELYDIWGIRPIPTTYYDKLEIVRRYFELREPITQLLEENSNAWKDIHNSWESVMYYKRFLSDEGRRVRGLSCKLIDSGADFTDVFSSCCEISETLCEEEIVIIIKASFRFVTRFGVGVTDEKYRKMLIDKYGSNSFLSAFYDL